MAKKKNTRPAAPFPGDTTSRKNLGREPVIDDESLADPGMRDLVFCPVIDGQPKGHGYEPRDYARYPAEMFDPPADIKLIPRPEWSDRAKEKAAAKSQISDIIRDAWPALNQGEQGFCWSYSAGGCVMCLRTMQGQPYVRLNPHSVAAVIKQGRDEGGWCGLSAKFLREVGIASEAAWPGRQYRNWQQLYERAKDNYGLHKVTEEWADLTRQVYDQNLTQDQAATCALANIPFAGDFNWWSHSVLICDLVEVEPGSFGWRLRNSWTDQWGDKGFGIIRGSKWNLDGAVALRVTGGGEK